MSKKKKPDAWMPLYIGDYLADTSRLTTEQHGAYLLLIMDYWRNGPVPDDDEVLASVTKASVQTWKRLRPSLIGFFRIIEGRWQHKRIDDELQKATHLKIVRTENGKLGGRPKLNESKREAK